MQLETAQKDKELIWHPFTQASDYEKELLPVITRAKGLKLFDSKGNFYYDTLSSWWTNSLGHCHPLLVKAAQKQLSLLDHVIFAGFTHKPAVDLCTKLSEILPSHLSRFFFSDNGSTSIEVALKIAFQYWKNINKPKSKFAYFTHAYHGDTLGAMSVDGINLYHCRGNKKRTTNCNNEKGQKIFTKNKKILLVLPILWQKRRQHS